MNTETYELYRHTGIAIVSLDIEIAVDDVITLNGDEWTCTAIFSMPCCGKPVYLLELPHCTNDEFHGVSCDCGDMRTWTFARDRNEILS